MGQHPLGGAAPYRRPHVRDPLGQSGIGCVALTDELTAFQNHTAAIPTKQRAMVFAASSYEEILAELDTGQENQNTRLQTYREVYDCLKLPLFLLPCNDTGCLQLRIMGVPNYRELLARIILKSHYVPPPANRTMCDALYQGVPFVMAADMDLRRIDAAVEAARSDGISQIALAALPEQAETVLNRRYRETGKARVFTITDAALRELIEAPCHTRCLTCHFTHRKEVFWMFRLSKLLEKLEDKLDARFKSWFARNKAKLPSVCQPSSSAGIFYGMFLNSLRLGIASTFHQTDEEIQSIWVLNPFKNWGAVFTGFGIVTTLVIILIICLITKKGYIWFSGYKYTHDPRGFDILPDGTWHVRFLTEKRNARVFETLARGQNGGHDPRKSQKASG